MKKIKLDIQLFNGSCAIQIITETTDNTLNQSTFTIPAKMTTTGATYNNSNASMTLQWKYASGSTWTTISKQTFKIGKNSSVTKNWTLTLTHEPDGTLENVNFRVQWYITDSTNGTTGTTTFEPTTIPRASVPTLSTSSALFGNTITITTNRYSSSFTHTLTYSYGSHTGTIASNVGASYNWTIPNDYMNWLPNATSAVFTILCTTYSNSTTIGVESVNITLTIPTTIVPTISNVTLEEVGLVPSTWHVWVQGKSKIKFTYSASGAYSSTISSYSTSIDGYTLSGNPATTTNYIQSSGYLPYSSVYKVTDSRGRVATKSQSPTLYVYSYSNPTISTTQVQRCDVNGNIDSNGEYMYVSYGASIKALGDYNTPYGAFKIGYRVHGTSSYSYITLASQVYQYSVSGVLFSDGIKSASASGTKVQFSTNNTYDIIFYAQDYFNPNGITNTQLLDSGFDLLNFNASGKSMAIGKVSEASANEELLEVALPTKFYEPLKGEVVVDSIRSKNMIDYKKSVNGYISSGDTSETLRTGNDTITSAWIEVEPNTTYIISGSKNRTIWQLKNNSGTITGTLNTTSITTNNDTKFVRVYYYVSSGAISPTSITDIQVEKGSTATTYSPYQELNPDNFKNEEIVVGSIRTKNMFDYKKDIATTGGATAKLIDKTIRVINYSTGNYHFVVYKLFDASSMVGETFTLSLKSNKSGSNSYQVNIIMCDKDGGNRQNIQSIQNVQNINQTFTIPTISGSSKYLGLNLYATGSSSANAGDYIDYTNIQLEKGSVATAYFPYQDLNNNEPVVLWTNSSPASAFANQTITLYDSLDNYSYYEVIFSYDKNDIYDLTTGKIKANKQTILSLASNYLYRRVITAISGTSITFGKGQIFQTLGVATDNNDYIIPLKVLGYK